MHLGICNNTGLVYKGMGAADIPPIPTPNVAQAKLIEAEGDWKDLPRGLSVHQRGLADDQGAAMAEALSACDMQSQYEVAKRFSFMEELT